MPVFIDTHEITDDQVHDEMQHHPAPSLEEARREASRALIIKHLLMDAAIERKLVTAAEVNDMDNDKEELLIETLLDQVIQVPSADEDTCQRYYDQNTDRFKDKTNGETLPYTMVKAHIKTFLEDKGHQAAFNAFIDRLMDKVNIVGMV